MNPDYRPDFRWILTGPLIGALSGTAVAFEVLMVVLTVDGPVPSVGHVLAGAVPVLLLAVVFGGLVGAGVGLLAGLPLVFLVGRHVSALEARRRAFALGVLLPPLAMVAAFSVLTGEPPGLPSHLPRGEEWLELVWLPAASLLGGPLAARAATRTMPRPDVS
ncbi:hypothetical protein [Nocardioides zhouii]|uniref:Uncharacterized protein n=1 Tax=Nocardioides zhouii TaxID=1168729 RepID=A0A4Q2TAF9_9ACTN|nr:hypothetical protein [Nocardioides zhouii]RYC14230.1 hypothetical protein EUA94_02670 [Nocardioides zhouii]